MGIYAAVRAVAGFLPPDTEENDLTTRSGEALGIKRRHLGGGRAASDMAVEAGEALFHKYVLDRQEIDFVLLCTQFPDYYVPTTACMVAERLGLPKSCGALDYNLGCSGYVYGLALAKGLLETGMSKNLLLLTSSLYTQWASKEDSATRPVFGDASTATLLSAVEAEQPLLSGFTFGTDGAGFDKIIVPVGGSRNDYRYTEDYVIEDDHGSRRFTDGTMDGQGIMYFTLHRVPQLVNKVLEKTGLTREELDYCVFHQPNRFMLEYVRKKCKLMEVPFYNDIEETGNTVPSTIPLAMERVFAFEDASSLQRVLLAGFGVGLSWAGCIADCSRVLPLADDISS